MGARQCFMLEALYNLPLRAQTLHSKELKQELASWCSPRTEFIENNQLPKFLACRPLRKVTPLWAEVAHGLNEVSGGGDCCWPTGSRLLGGDIECGSETRGLNLGHAVGRQEWECLVVLGGGLKVFGPGELTEQLGKDWQSLWWPLANTPRTCAAVHGTSERRSTPTSAH